MTQRLITAQEEAEGKYQGIRYLRLEGHAAMAWQRDVNSEESTLLPMQAAGLDDGSALVLYHAPATIDTPAVDALSLYRAPCQGQPAEDRVLLCHSWDDSGEIQARLWFLRAMAEHGMQRCTIAAKVVITA